MYALGIISLIGVLFSLGLVLFFVHSIASELPRSMSTKKGTHSIWFHVLETLREHRRLFPVSESMLGFWLALIYLVISLSCVVYVAIFRL